MLCGPRQGTPEPFSHALIHAQRQQGTHHHTFLSQAKAELGWAARRSLEDMCKDLWAWQSANPNGYAK